MKNKLVYLVFGGEFGNEFLALVHSAEQVHYLSCDYNREAAKAQMKELSQLIKLGVPKEVAAKLAKKRYPDCRIISLLEDDAYKFAEEFFAKRPQ